tara:strand:- start:69 stop:659 length:591 start_codon:yes stop_codon:yes gene_type:complete
MKKKFLPQSIYYFNSGVDILSSTLQNLKEDEWLNESNITQQTKDIFLHKNIKYSKLYTWINKCLREVHQDLEYESDGLKITISWGNRISLGANFHQHSHSNSIISGVYYLNDTSTPTDFAIEDMWYNNIVDLSGNSRRMVCESFCGKSGDLIIFPSSITHRVDTHQSIESRYTISFNSFPYGKIGGRKSMMNLTVN